jgi:trehalose 6-phosphate synthase
LSVFRLCATARTSLGTLKSNWAAGGWTMAGLRGPDGTIAIEAFPDRHRRRRLREEAERNVRAAELRSFSRVPDCHRIVGVDRLDYSKGLPERIRGVEACWKPGQPIAAASSLLQIAPPTREGVEAYDVIRAELEQLTGQVNGRFGDLSWSPIRYIHRAVARPVLAGLFRRCRVGLVTPLRDGMNLVAKEYVAGPGPADPGVLVCRSSPARGADGKRR